MSTIYDEMEDRPDPEDERAEAWEFWHERAHKLEIDNFQLRAALREIHVLTRDLSGVRDIVDRAINDRSLDIGRVLSAGEGQP